MSLKEYATVTNNEITLFASSPKARGSYFALGAVVMPLGSCTDSCVQPVDNSNCLNWRWHEGPTGPIPSSDPRENTLERRSYIVHCPCLVVLLIAYTGRNYGSFSVECSKVHPLFEPAHVIPCVGNLTEEKYCVVMFEFHTGLWILEVRVCWKMSLSNFLMKT
jgi:hypothetical protein